jgi:hypothetical protein
MREVLDTRTADFIGYHLTEVLLYEGVTVRYLDAMTEHCDVTVKQARQAGLRTRVDSSLLKSRGSKTPSTVYRIGVRRFVDWYSGYYQR